ncbi:MULTISPECIES: enoyl-CoA hydratase/isomerase family protein [unclassified Moraxella]|uniref:enoyl-CoA hydratase/isomerase family protein n=1 Tax=unclassified Moraxella TaxID=2685852 RepID=UPI003AF6C848
MSNTTPTYQKVIYQVADGVATITLNDPASLNALDSVMKAELYQALRHADYDSEAKVIVLTGAGKGFSSGGDIREMLGSTESREAVLNMAKNLTSGVGDVTRLIRKISKPIIARINGACAGAGMNIALACDFRVASDNAKFVQAFVNIGLVPDAGGIYLLSQLVGVAKATELVMLGEQIDAQKAQDLGLANAIVPMDELDNAVKKITDRLTGLPSLALSAMKQSINQVAFAGLDIALDQEVIYQMQMALTEDFKEGVTAFMQKRLAKFTGK